MAITWLKHLPRFRAAYRAMAELEARESWSRSEIEAYQLERLNAQWAHAVRHVPYYRRIAAEQNLPPRFASRDEFQAVVPVVTKQDIGRDSRQFVSERAGRGCWRQTSGSTGDPLRLFVPTASHHEMLRTRYRGYAMWGVDIFDPIVFLWGETHRGPTLRDRVARLQSRVEDRLRNRLRLSGYHLDPATLQNYLRRIERFQPTSIYGYGMATYLLAREAAARGFDCGALKLVTLTAEPSLPHMVEQCEKAFGVPALIEYGSSECGTIASEWRDRTLRVREDITLVETAPRDDGRYELIVTPFYNVEFPLIRYAIGDTTDAPLVRPERGFAMLRNIIGRHNDVLVSNAGHHLHPARAARLFEQEFYPFVRRFRIHQRNDGSLDVHVESRSAAAQVPSAQLIGRLRELVGFPVQLSIVDQLQPTAAGKHRWIISDRVA